MSKSIIIADRGNSRLVERSIPELTYIAELTNIDISRLGLYGENGYALASDATDIYYQAQDYEGQYFYKISKADASDYIYIAISNSFSYGMAVDDTHVYMADYNNNQVTKHLKSTLAIVATSVQMIGVEGVCVDDNYVFVTNYDDCAVVKMDKTDLSILDSYGTFGTANDELDSPEGICSYGTYIYIVDSGNHRIVKRNVSDLVYVDQIGSFGTGNNEFDNPIGIVTDGTYLYICDYGNGRIVKRNLALVYVSEAAMNGAYDISFDGTNLDVLDGNNYLISHRDTTNSMTEISQFTSYLQAPSNVTMSFPPSVCNDGTYIYTFKSAVVF